MSCPWCNPNAVNDKRKNLNWDLLPPKPQKAEIARTIFANENNFPKDIDTNININEQWTKLSNPHKRRYESLASEEHKCKIENWKRIRSELKRPPGAFVLFMMDLWQAEKAKGKVRTLVQMSVKAKVAWYRASQRKRSIYRTKARELLIQYNAFYSGFRIGKAVQ